MVWGGGLAEWDDGDTTNISVAFTWRLDDAYMRAVFAKARGQRVRVGGPAVFLRKLAARFDGVAEVGGDCPGAIARHNQAATIASRGCPVGCWFCIVPAMEGRSFTLDPDFPVRPVLCDSNLSALPADFQDHIIRRYQDWGVRLTDANSGFEPATFTVDVYSRWKPIINAGRGPWRFAYDETGEGADVRRVMRMLESETPSRKRVFVLIGNEPYAECMGRIQEVIDGGCEPHVQWLVKLNALEKKPSVRHDWSAQLLRDVARWSNRWIWRRAPFSEYNRSQRAPACIPATTDQLELFAEQGASVDGPEPEDRLE